MMILKNNNKRSDNKILKIKIISKNGERDITVKKFPVFIGSGNGKNIIKISDNSLPAKYGVFFEKNGKLFYQDHSPNGTRINSQVVKHSTVELKSGTSVFQIGRYKVLVEYESKIDETITKYSTTKKKIFRIFTLLVALALFSIGGWFAYQYFISPPVVNINKFSFQSHKFSNIGTTIKDNEINVYADSIKVNVEFSNKEVKLDSSSQIILFCKNSTTVDTLVLPKGQNIINGPNSFLKYIDDDDNVNIKIFITSDNFVVKDTTNYQIIKLRQIEKIVNEGYTIISYPQQKLAKFFIKGNFTGVEKIEINYGDGSQNDPIKVNPTEDLITAIHTYNKKGTYSPIIYIRGKNNTIKFKKGLIKYKIVYDDRK